MIPPDAGLDEKPDAARITVADMDALLSFLPRFEEPGRAFVKEWTGGKKTSSGAISMPYPVYHDDVRAFFTLAGRPPWPDYGYRPAEAQARLEDDAFIAECTLTEFRSMLTLCVRGERFSDGYWEYVLKQGRITVLLRRLAEIRAIMA